jgi:Putative prokaryotic signal transducing protein
MDEIEVEPEFDRLVTIRKFRDLPAALLAKGVLESSGIQCRLLDDNMVRMDWFLSNLLGGMRLQVPSEEVDTANAILDQPIPENFDVPGTGDYPQPHCLKCESLDIAYQELYAPVFFAARKQFAGRHDERVDPDALVWVAGRSPARFSSSRPFRLEKRISCCRPLRGAALRPADEGVCRYTVRAD